MIARTPGLDGGKENKVMGSSVQMWLTGLDILSTIKRRDLGIRQFRGNMDITDWKLSDSEPCRSKVANWT